MQAEIDVAGLRSNFGHDRIHISECFKALPAAVIMA
jgi:hypothetical protein